MLVKEKQGFAPLHVLVPGGRDAPCVYARGVPGPADGGHAPVNFHAMAAATRGSFVTSDDTAAIPDNGVILLLAGRRLGRCLRAAKRLKARGRRVWVTWKECGSHQIALAARGWFAQRRMARLIALADGIVAASAAAKRFFEDADVGAKLHVLPTPYPVEHAEWDFSRPLDNRAGVWIGTREPHVPSRRHDQAVRLALDLAAARGCHASVVNTRGMAGRRHHLALAEDHASRLRIIDGPLSYPDYLHEMAGHRVVVQRDASEVPGQVAGDALLARMPCLGGNGLVDVMSHSEAASLAKDEAALREQAASLLADDAAWHAWVEESQGRALRDLGFGAFRREWARVSG